MDTPSPFRAPKSFHILNPSNFVSENGFPVVKASRNMPKQARCAHLWWEIYGF